MTVIKSAQTSIPGLWKYRRLQKQIEVIPHPFLLDFYVHEILQNALPDLLILSEQDDDKNT